MHIDLAVLCASKMMLAYILLDAMDAIMAFFINSLYALFYRDFYKIGVFVSIVSTHISSKTHETQYWRGFS